MHLVQMDFGVMGVMPRLATAFSVTNKNINSNQLNLSLKCALCCTDCRKSHFRGTSVVLSEADGGAFNSAVSTKVVFLVFE